MLEAVFGSEGAERILLYIAARGEGYAYGIAETLDMPVSNVQRHLERMERGGLLASSMIGRTRMYRFNPRFGFLPEVKTLLEKALARLPETMRAKLVMQRRRPRRAGKPL